MLSLLPPLLALLAAIAYFVVAVGMGVPRAPAWPFLLIALVASTWSLTRAVKLRRILPALAAAFALAITGLYAWYAFSYSDYQTRERQIRAGHQLASLDALSFKNHRDDPASVLAAAPARATLLVFYRGFW